MKISIHTLTPARWGDFERLFGARGACGGCWCMWFRLPRKTFNQQKGEGNRRALRALAAAGPAPGLLAYDRLRPVGWCAVGPREAFPVLARSRVAKPVDDLPAWSVVCFFVDKATRGRGLTRRLLEAAVAHAAAHGAATVEGYPVEPKSAQVPPVFAYHGLAATFRAAGFTEVARRTPTRPFMRRSVAGP